MSDIALKPPIVKLPVTSVHAKASTSACERERNVASTDLRAHRGSEEQREEEGATGARVV